VPEVAAGAAGGAAADWLAGGVVAGGAGGAAAGAGCVAEAAAAGGVVAGGALCCAGVDAASWPPSGAFRGAACEHATAKLAATMATSSGFMSLPPISDDRCGGPAPPCKIGIFASFAVIVYD
jgi:hypothetical protein